MGAHLKNAPSAPATLLAAIMALLLVGTGWLIRNDDLLPPNSLPWKPVRLDAPPGWLAHWQMGRLKLDAGLCRTALDGASRLRVTALADRRVGDCGLEGVLRADANMVAFAPRVTATCPLQAALYWYQRQLAPQALAQMGSPLVRISQLGTFSCRNVNSQAEGRRSEHASANAIDVARFHFANGKIASVRHDYGKPTAEGRFLKAAHALGCGVFNAGLGPDYNRLHADHFHFDMGRYRICV